jgi:hypothetical protein
MLTPELLNGFFDGINSERFYMAHERTPEEVREMAEAPCEEEEPLDEGIEESKKEERETVREIAGVSNRYDEFLI